MFMDFDDLTLYDFLDSIGAIDYLKDKLSINRQRGCLNAIRWVIEGQGALDFSDKSSYSDFFKQKRG